MTKDSEPFLDRWSRRKRSAGGAPAQGGGEKPVEPTMNVPVEGSSEGEKPETSEQNVDDLPDIDSLDKDSDYTGFLREGVPEHLKKQALRKLWRSDPVLANLDGLNDYDEDYTLMFTKAVTESVKTAYRVGKGMIESDGGETEATEESSTAGAEPGAGGGTATETADTEAESREEDAPETAVKTGDLPPKMGKERNA